MPSKIPSAPALVLAVLVSLLYGSAAHTGAGPGNTIEEKLARFMENAEKEGFRGVVLVARDRAVLLERGYGLMRAGGDRRIPADAVFTVGSITKQFTAAAVLKLQEDGKLSVTDTLRKYFPGTPAEKRDITLHQLLTHQAGFPDVIGHDRERIGRDAFIERALSVELIAEPGAEYHYSNVGFSLAAAIVEKVSGQSYEEFLRDYLWEPAGLGDTGYRLPRWELSQLAHGWTDDGGDWGTVVGRFIGKDGPGWNLLGNGGVHSTAHDMYLWHQALQSNRVLSAASRRAMVRRHADEGGGTWYGYGWSIEPTPWGEAVTHNGGNGIFFADYLRFPESDAVIFLATSSRDRRLHDLARPLARILFTGEVPELASSAGPLIETGTGPPAEEGTPAARWRLPGSVQGQRAGAFLDTLASDDPAAWHRFVESAFASELIERRGVDGLVSAMGSLEDEVGRFTLRGVRPIGDTAVAIVLDRVGGHPLEIILHLEAGESHRIHSLEMRAED